MKPKTNPTAIVMIGHGTSHPQGLEQFEKMVAALQAGDPQHQYYSGFMELAEPGISDAVALAVADGHRKIFCQPSLLLAAGHGKNDLPAIIRELAKDHASVELRYGSPMGLSAEIVALCARQVRETAPGHDFSDSTLLVVGRGTSDPDANSEVSKLARMMEEGLGFAESAVCYFSTTQPRLATGLERAATRTSGPVIVFPFIMFSGVLNRRLDAALGQAMEELPQSEFTRIPPFGTAEGFSEAMLHHIHHTVSHSVEMPCIACKYRAALPGHEHEVGQTQPSGHHHHHHGHAHCHDHK